MSTFWEDFKDIFKTNKQKAEVKTQKLKDAKEGSDNLAKQLFGLEKEYYESLPQEEEVDFDALFPITLGLSEKTYQPKTDEEILEQATNEQSKDKDEDLNDLQTKYAKSSAKLQTQKDETADKLEDEAARLVASYSNNAKKAGNDAVKNGMARSSVYIEMLKDLANGYQTDSANMNADYTAKLSNLDGQIDALTNERANALQSLDNEYAEKLDNRIEALKTERQKTQESVESYNASVRNKETKYQATRQKSIKSYLDTKRKEAEEEAKAQAKKEAEEGYSGDKLDSYNRRYDLAYDYYMALDADIAADALEASPSIKYYLGNYYDKLLSALQSRTATKKKYF